MDLSVLILGTGARWPTPERALAASVVMRGGERLLIDCGEGTQRQLMGSTAGLRRLTTILISHSHPDHVLGMPGLLATLEGQRHEALTILGPVGTRRLVARLRASVGTLDFEVRVRDLSPGDRERRAGYWIEAVEARHVTASLAWLVEEDGRSGHLDPGRLRGLGVPEGPDRRRLARGLAAETPEGRSVRSAEVTGPPRRGRRILFSGDTRPAPAVEAAARNADLLVHEATFLERDAAIARRSGHSTAAEAAGVAQRTGVGLLALTHRSTRYAREEVLAEARAIFPRTVVPSDLDLIDVPEADRGRPRLRPGGGRAAGHEGPPAGGRRPDREQWVRDPGGGQGEE